MSTQEARRYIPPESAALPLAGGTAWEALFERAALEPGESVLVHAAAGGVGSLAVQLAKAAGAVVLATCGGGNVEFVITRCGSCDRLSHL